MGAKQPKYLCSICKFNSDGHCVADESTDWCPKLLLPNLSSTRRAMEWWRDRCRKNRNELEIAADALVEVTEYSPKSTCDWDNFAEDLSGIAWDALVKLGRKEP